MNALGHFTPLFGFTPGTQVGLEADFGILTNRVIKKLDFLLLFEVDSPHHRAANVGSAL
jgi:hypothetical protein